ncbi:MAG TPA: transglutaminase-like domain-containing protein [Thermoanaerobaculia bacterium]|jgi:regulator of sirC expression with transglutaminase-like and TPR domain|nr:transglutaminase-like domain-containing protein [Thermoanaerobaculia bacterium]
MNNSGPREHFAALARLPENTIDLGAAALWIAAEEQPGLDPDPWLERLDVLGERLQDRLRGVGDDLGRLSLLTHLLFGEEGLRGNADDFYDPRNSFLNQVLDRRLGIPITLAVVCMEVGRRAGLVLEGIGFPGHFLLRLARYPNVVIDPFDGGRLLSGDDCEAMLERITQGSQGSRGLDPRRLRPAGPRQILQRVLNNLRGIYVHRGELERTVAVLDRLLLLDPDDPAPLRDRGLLHVRWGDPEQGIADLTSYLAAESEAEDGEDVAAVLAEARRRLDLVC